MMLRLPLMFTCAGLLIAQSTQSLEKAWKLAANGQRDEAVQILQRLVSDNPRDAEARLLLGSLLMEAGKRADSITQLSEAVKLRPQSADAQNALGEAYSGFGDLKAARGPFEKAVALKPDFGVAQMNLGEALLAAGELGASAQHLDRATKLLGKTDDGAQAHYLRAKVYTALSDSEKAAAELQTAVAIHPAFPQAWSDLGEARKILMDDAGALTALKRAVELDPNDSVAQYRLGAEYLEADKPRDAVAHLEQAYRLNAADQSTLNALQQALRQEGRDQEAAAIKQQLALLLRKKDEDNQNAVAAADLNNEGAELEKAGNLRAALVKYQAAVQHSPKNVTMRVNYAVALLRSGQWNEGLNQLHTASLQDPANASIQQALKEALAQAPAGTIPDWARR